MRTLSAVSAAIAVLALASCSSATPAAEVTTAPAVKTTAPAVKTTAPVVKIKAPTTPRKPASNCFPVPTAYGQSIISAARAGSGAKFVRASAVKSPAFAKVYFIAVEFSATGVDNQVGVFASNGLMDGAGLVMAVDGVAKQFTVWPDAGKTTAAISGSDPSVVAAKACLK